MNTNEKLIVVLGLGVSWYLYTAGKGLSVTGQPVNPMIAPGSRAFSAVQPNGSVAVNATNVLGSLFGTFTSALGKVITKQPGNAPAVDQQTPYGSGEVHTDTFGNSVYAWLAGITPMISPGDVAFPDTTVPLLAWTNPTSLIDAPPPPDPATGIPLWQWSLGDTSIPAPPGA